MTNPLLAQIPAIFPLMAETFELLRVGEAQSDDATGGFSGPNEETSKLEPIGTICEPMIPESKAQSMQMGEGGSFTDYAYQWFSMTKYPKGTLVRYDSLTLEVVEIEPYWSQGGFAIYYMQNRSDTDVQS
ncbi:MULTISPECIES: hypothetical protein [Levilactobacillus]|uniref:hypothetical protein n=1 Tax=Levilactobacillus TaxID=2767886 RepID=UPI0012E76192|nr:MULTISPECIES: hypothetical protein [Levilactobacillus]MUV40481.1 hypothetical protein [Levilactobacillus brevis]NLR32769.1 hypothetical protein [Levilactobacillus tujiorum]